MQKLKLTDLVSSKIGSKSTTKHIWLVLSTSNLLKSYKSFKGLVHPKIMKNYVM